jgi:hypothetical protein
MMRRHLEWLIDDHWNPPCRLELAWGPPDVGPVHARTFPLDQLDLACIEAVRANASGNNVYVGVTLKHQFAPAFSRTKSEHATITNCIALDFDEEAQTGVRRLFAIAKPQLLVVTGIQPRLRLHAWLRLYKTNELDRWHELTRRCALHCGADIAAIGKSRLMRLAGTVSYPNSHKVARGYQTELVWLYEKSGRYTLDWLDERCPRSAQFVPIASTKNTRQRLPLNVTNLSMVQSVLDTLPSAHAIEYRAWLNVGFALHDMGWGIVGLALWKHFSERCLHKALTTDFDKIWSRFDTRDGERKITLGSLIHYAKAAGWRSTSCWDLANRVAVVP